MSLLPRCPLHSESENCPPVPDPAGGAETPAETAVCVICQKQTPRLSPKTRFCGRNCRATYYRRQASLKRRQRNIARASGAVVVQTVKYGADTVIKPPSRTLGKDKARKKHVNVGILISEFPAKNKGATDGVDVPHVQLEYEYHPKQEIASMAIEAGAKIIFFVAGVRSGKTIWLVRELIKQPYVYDVVPNLIFLVAPTNGMMPTTRRFFTANAGDALISERRSSDAGPAHFIMKPSRSIHDRYFIYEMHSGEHPDRMRGPTIAAAGIDEAQLCKPEVMDVLRGRVMESGGIIALAGTATYPGHWTKTEIIDRAYRCGKCHACVYDHYDLALGDDGNPETDPASGKETRRYVPKDHDPVDCYGDPRIAVITCSSFDNTFLTRENVEQLRQDYAAKDPIIARRELFAEYTGFEGLIYSRFDRNVHKSPYTVWNVPPEATLVAGLDFGANDPTACVFLAKIAETWHAIGEYCDEDRAKALSDHVKGIKKAAGPCFNRIRAWWHDPSGRIAAMEMSRQGLRPMKAARKRMATGTHWVRYRIDVVNSLILGRDDKDKPYFLVNPQCKWTIQNLENRKWKRYVSKGEDGRERIVDLKGHEVDRNAGDDPQPGNDHCSDSLEYALVSEFVKGLYKPKKAENKIETNGEIVVPSAVQHDLETANISRAVARSLQSVIDSTRKRGRGRARPGWIA